MGFETVEGLKCPKCGCVKYYISRRYFRSGEMYHIGAYCSACHTWIKWIPKSVFEEDSKNGI